MLAQLFAVLRLRDRFPRPLAGTPACRARKNAGKNIAAAKEYSMLHGAAKVGAMITSAAPTGNSMTAACSERDKLNSLRTAASRDIARMTRNETTMKTARTMTPTIRSMRGA